MERKKWKNEREGKRSQPKTEKKINKRGKKRYSLFLDVTQHRSMVSHGRFGINYRSHLQGSSSVRGLLGLLDP